MAIVHDRASGGAELETASWLKAGIEMPGWNALRDGLALAVRNLAFSFVRDELGNLVATADRAADAIRPAHRFEVGNALFRGSELTRNVYQGRCVVHASSMR